MHCPEGTSACLPPAWHCRLCPHCTAPGAAARASPRGPRRTCIYDRAETRTVPEAGARRRALIRPDLLAAGRRRTAEAGSDTGVLTFVHSPKFRKRGGIFSKDSACVQYARETIHTHMQRCSPVILVTIHSSNIRRYSPIFTMYSHGHFQVFKSIQILCPPEWAVITRSTGSACQPLSQFSWFARRTSAAHQGVLSAAADSLAGLGVRGGVTTKLAFGLPCKGGSVWGWAGRVLMEGLIRIRSPLGLGAPRLGPWRPGARSLLLERRPAPAGVALDAMHAAWRTRTRGVRGVDLSPESRKNTP